MSFPNRCAAFGIVVLLLAASSPNSLRAETVVLHPSADTTLIEIAKDSNLGGAPFFNAGFTGVSTRNRGLIQFALSESIPAGSIITGAVLTFDLVRQPNVDMDQDLFTLHRMLVSWGEGDKVPDPEGSPGFGSPATTGDATWNHRFFGTTPWSTPGGQSGTDFATSPTAIIPVYGIGDPVVIESDLALIADVQFWLNNPDQNFGWMFKAESEAIRKSARGFASREDPSGGPTLVIEFTPVPEPSTWALSILGSAALFWTVFRSRRKESP
jgi:hypothetical protein